MSSIDILNDDDIDVFMYLADALISEVDANSLKHEISPGFPMEKLHEYAKLTPSKIPGYRDGLLYALNNTGTYSANTLKKLSVVLNSKFLAPVLTGSFTLVKDMTIEQRQSLLFKWRDSSIPDLRKLSRSFTTAAVNLFSKMAGDLHNQAIGYPGKELRNQLYDNADTDDFSYSMMDKPGDNSDLYLPNIDVIIIGSGAGAGVTAHTLSQEGYKCLVLEKGKYYKSSEFNFDDNEGFKDLYENGAAMTTTNSETLILAGSTFGGGTTVNWSACIKTPFKVRNEWYDDYGVDWAANDDYDKCTDYVWQKMGATTDNLTHSFSNQVLLNGCEKLGYHNTVIAQNNGGHPNHSCGFCYLGCKYGIKQGSQSCWFKDALMNGCQFMDQVRVDDIIHAKGKAIGIRCTDTTNGSKFQITGAKKFVVASGSLNTPVLLQNSGFKNKNIGANLKLHPVSVILGTFGKEVETKPHENSIMTSLSNQVADLDGKAHGAKIETILHAPAIESCFLPWTGSTSFRKDLVKYNNTVALLVLTRDTSSGKVYGDPTIPHKSTVDYSINKFDLNSILQGILIGADTLYIEGAKEILISQGWTPRFICHKPKHSRSITDKDYVEWRQQVEAIGISKYGLTHGSAHQMSSCRIANTPNKGALDLNGRLYECKNIYVADASAMPTGSGANPMISTMAVSRHTALGIVKDLKPQPRL